MNTRTRTIRQLLPPSVAVSHEVSTAREMLLDTAVLAIRAGYLDAGVAIADALEHLKTADTVLRHDVANRDPAPR